MINKHFITSVRHTCQSAISCVAAGKKTTVFALGIGLSFVVSAAPTAYTLNNDAKSKVIAIFDCAPSFSGKAGLGDNKYIYVWECEHNTDSKYAIYKTSYTSRFGFTLSSKSEAVDFFTKYLTNKVSSYLQNPRMSDLRHVIQFTNYSSKRSAYADYFITYYWDKKYRMAQQGRFIFNNGYIADWSVASLMESSVAAEEFNGYVNSFQIKVR